jgi:hypothetical protein
VLNDATAFGGLYLVTLVIVSYFDDPARLTTIAASPGLAVVVAVGALSVGATLSLLSDVVWRRFGPFHSPRRVEIARKFPTTHGRVASFLPNKAEQAVVVTAYEFHHDGDGGIQTWVSRRQAAFAASANAVVAIVVALVTSLLVLGTVSLGWVAAAAVFMGLAVWKFVDGIRQLREADAMELAWLLERADAPPKPPERPETGG